MHGLMRALALLLVFAATPALAEGGERFDLKTAVSPETVALGGAFTLTVVVERAEGDRLALEAEPNSEKVRAAGRVERVVERVAEGRVKETLRFPFLALDYEDVKTPSIQLRAPDGERVEIPPLAVKVEDALVEPTTEPQAELVPDAAARLAWFAGWDRRPFIALGVLLMGLLGMLIGWLWSKRTPRVAPVPAAPAPPPVPIDVRALARLDALLAEGLLAKGEVPVFTGRLMDEVLRFYLEGRFDIPAERSTTRELAEELLAVGHSALDSDLVRSILESADLVKFARADLQASAAQKMAGQVRALVEATRVERQEAA
jgi:hypothetical protein